MKLVRLHLEVEIAIHDEDQAELCAGKNERFLIMEEQLRNLLAAEKVTIADVDDVADDSRPGGAPPPAIVPQLKLAQLVDLIRELVGVAKVTNENNNTLTRILREELQAVRNEIRASGEI